MAINFCLYYQTRENCQYLKNIIDSSRQGKLVESKSLDHLPAHVNSGANVIFLEYQEDNQELDQWIKKIAADPHNPVIFLFFQEISTDRLWKALRLGAKECFTFPIRGEEFQEALDRLPLPASALGIQEGTCLISVLGCKGGVGTTFLTTNLAYLLAQEQNGQVLLVDLDLRYGQMVYFFDAKPKYTLIKAVENSEHLDSAYLQSLFFQYDKNLQLLPAPTRLEEAEAITPEHLEKTLRHLKHLRYFKYILVDAGHQLDEINLKALDLSDTIILVANQSIPALSNAKKLLELFQLLGLENRHLEIWLNSWQKHGDLTVADVSAFLGKEIRGTIAFDSEQVGRSINEGKPLTKTSPHHHICRDLTALAQQFLGAEAGNRKGPWRALLKFWRRDK
ncbi:MAG: AAA family ATPase [Thermodesulfobacteriota bacterium]